MRHDTWFDLVFTGQLHLSDELGVVRTEVTGSRPLYSLCL